MKTFLIVVVFLLTTSVIFPQQKGSISGIVLENSTDLPLSDASASLLDSDNKIVKGGATDLDGKFFLDEIPFGRYRLEISMIGYSTTVVPDITLNSGNASLDIGKVRLKSGEMTTDEIVIESERSKIEFKGDRRIFNVEENLTLRGGSAIDVLREVPSVTVDVEGNVSVRGSENVRILIDGRPSGLDGSNRTIILEQISADQIDRVELITNPSVRFEAEGTTGIINIILKKSESFGYNGNVTLNAGTKDKYTGGLYLNFRKDNLNFFGNLNYNSFNFESSGSSSRSVFLSSGTSSLSQTANGFRRRISNSISSGFDYSFDKSTLLGLTLSYRTGDPTSARFTASKEVDANGNLIADYIRKSNENEKGDNIDISMRFQHNFDEKEHKITSDFNFNRETDDENVFTDDEYIFPVVAEPTRLNEITDETENNLSLRVDYSYPVKEKLKLEAGYKGDISKRDLDVDNRFYNYSLNQYVTDTTLSNRFIYKQQVHGIYAILGGNISDFGFSFGLRAEQTIICGDLVTTGENFDNDYIDFFPSVSLSRKLGISQELQISYSRRIQRPRQWSLNPFKRVSDPQNIYQGNPKLKPAFTNSLELNYINYFDFGTITPSIFYRHTTDDITRTSILLDSVTTLTTFDNLATAKSYGGEIIFNTQPFKELNLTGSFSYFKSEVDPGESGIGTKRSDYSWSTRFSSSVNLPADFGLQLSYYYSGERFSAQGTIEPFQGMDVALRKDLFDKKLSLTLRVSDLFDTQKFRVRIDDQNYVESFERRWDSRNVFLNISYKFGTDEGNQDRKRRRNNDDSQPMDEGFGF